MFTHCSCVKLWTEDLIVFRKWKFKLEKTLIELYALRCNFQDKLFLSLKTFLLASSAIETHWNFLLLPKEEKHLLEENNPKNMLTC